MRVQAAVPGPVPVWTHLDGPESGEAVTCRGCCVAGGHLYHPAGYLKANIECLLLVHAVVPLVWHGCFSPFDAFTTSETCN